MSIGELRKITKKWQHKLGLDHWEVILRIAKSGDMPDDWCACVTWMVEYSSARVLINKNHCTEHSLVHELLHIRLEGHLAKPKAYDPQYEYSLNFLTDTLIGYHSDV